MKKLKLYILRWQLSTPILYLVMANVPYLGTLGKTILANLIGAVIFFPIDELIFKGNPYAIKKKIYLGIMNIYYLTKNGLKHIETKR